MHEQNQPTVLQTPGQVRTPDLLDHAQHLKAEARTIMGKFFDTQKEWIKNHPLGVIGNIVEVTAIMATPLAPNLGIGLILPYIGHMLNVRARILEDNARGLEQGHKDSISPKNIPMELVGATRAVILGILMRLPYYSPYTFQPSTGFPVLDKAIATASQEAYRFATTKHLSQGVGVAETAAPVTPTVMPTEVVPTVTDIAAQAPSVVDGSVPSITGIEPTQAVEQTKIIAHSAAEAAQAGASRIADLTPRVLEEGVSTTLRQVPDLEVLRRGLEIAWKDLGVTGEQLLSSPEATQLIIAVAVLAIILSAGTGVYIGSRLGHRAAQKELSKPKGSLGVLELDEANDKADRLAIRIKSVLGGASAASISLDALVNLRESGETFLEEVGGLKSKEIAAAKRYIADLQRQLDIIGI